MKTVNAAEILNGKTFSYIEVFGGTDGIALGTKFNEVLYYIYDRYCMKPSCKCDDVILYFVENNEHESEMKAEFTIVLSLKNKKYEILDIDGITKKQVEELVNHSLKDSNETMELLKKRYKDMKTAGREVLQESKPNNKALDEPVQAKPQRNAPCPCMSGKKYKKCCGA